MSCSHECGIEFANPQLTEICQGEVPIAGVLVCRAAWTKLRQDQEVHLLDDELVIDVREKASSLTDNNLMLIYGYK